MVALKAQAWTKRRGRQSNKIIDKEDTEEDPSAFGNFAALNEIAKAQELKKPKNRRRDRRASPMGDQAAMAEMMKQISGGDMAQLMKSLGSGGANIAELLKGLGDMGGQRMRTALMQSGNAMCHIEPPPNPLLLDMDVAGMMKQGMGMWKDMLDSPDMQTLLNDPDKMREMMTPFVEMMGGDKSKLEEVLSDPTKLKASMTQGLETMTELFSDPAKMQSMASQMLEVRKRLCVHAPRIPLKVTTRNYF